MRRLLAFAVAGISILAVSASATVEDGRSGPAAGDARCKLVTRVIRGKRKRVRVCPRSRPRPRPKPRADLSVEASFTPSPVSAGGTLTYTLTVRNHGPAAAPRAVSAHVIPVELSATSATTSRGECALPVPPPAGGAPRQLSAVACRHGSLPAGATATVTIDAGVRTITRRSLDARAAVASAPTRDPAPANNSAVVTTPVEGNCDPAYPTVCIPSPEPALTCGGIPYTNFPAQAPDPHKLDADVDGVACETIAGDPTDPPLIGAAYGHWRAIGCSVDGAGILATYGQAGVRPRVRLQLAAMRAAGIETLRLPLRHRTDATGEEGGSVSSAGGRLPEPYRTNLIRYLQDVRAARFERLTVAFSPEAANDPVSTSEELWDPARLQENWSFIADVRLLVNEHGPPGTRLDLIGEGVPADFGATRDRVKAYVAELYRAYVEAFGRTELVASAVALPDGAANLQDLIDAFAASGQGQPDVFSLRLQPDRALEALRQVDAVLSANGLSQPLVVSASAYEDAQLAGAIQEFRRTSTRRVLEVQQWPLRRGSGCESVSEAPPFRADAYHRALRGALPSARLTARLESGRPQVTTAYGHPATAVTAGTYTVVAVDRSRRAGIRLRGPRASRSTGAAFVGTARWQVRLRAGEYRITAAPSGGGVPLMVLAGG